LSDQFKENKVRDAGSTCGDKEKYLQDFVGKSKGKRTLGCLATDAKLISKWI
jgi:alpha-D-ribose 1-methylphosphonate 5-phosphate C-P lyase